MQHQRTVTTDAAPDEPACIFCAIIDRQAQVSMVYEDETVVAFMDLNPVTPGHLLVVPRTHAVGLEDLDGDTSAHAWSRAHDLSKALRRSSLRCEGVNILLCDGEVAFQTVFHFHLHVVPRYAGDGWDLSAGAVESERSILDNHARLIRAAIAGTG